MVITYRTIIAFLNENKMVTININRYGEQYLDIFAIVVIWLVCLISLFFLVKSIKHDLFLDKKTYETKNDPSLDYSKNFIDLNPKINLENKKTPFIGYVSKSNKKIKK